MSLCAIQTIDEFISLKKKVSTAVLVGLNSKISSDKSIFFFKISKTINPLYKVFIF